jgi:uncharacterized protein (DUF1800 family)
MVTAALPSLDKLDPAEVWEPWEPDDKSPWNLKWAGHLYRRAAFGASREELQAAVKLGAKGTFDLLFKGDKQRLEIDAELAEKGADAAGSNDPVDLRGWWMHRMLRGGPQLREKMTLFWHNHFATSISKIQKPTLMYKQNELLRKHALAKFRPFLLEMSKDPAMVLWLDGNNNIKAKPNENYAREIMELFSLGVGNYTEKDIREAARAFTGWHTDGQKFTFNAEQHDDGEKAVMGKKGKLDGGDIVKILLDQPAAARFLVRKLYRFFVSEFEQPSDKFLKPLSDAFRESDYDIAALMKTMLSSRHFYSEYAYRKRIKCPVEFVLGCVLCTGTTYNPKRNIGVTPRAMVSRLELLGQHLFAPPNVKGWEGGKAWLNTATVIARHNFAHALCISGRLNDGDPKPRTTIPIGVSPDSMALKAEISEPEDLVAFYADIMLQGDITKTVRTKLVDHVASESEEFPRSQLVKEMIHALMCMPEYQLA